MSDLSANAAKSKRPSGDDDAPRQQPMRPQSGVARRLSTDEKKVRRAMTRGVRKESTMNDVQREAALLAAMAKASPSEQAALTADLDALRARRAEAARADRETDFAATVVAAHLTPVVTHSRSTAQTDWLSAVAAGPESDATLAMKTAATQWFSKTSAEVREDRDEFAIQAQGAARRAAGPTGEQYATAERAFLDHVAHLYATTASVTASDQNGQGESTITNYERLSPVTDDEFLSEDWPGEEAAGVHPPLPGAGGQTPPGEVKQAESRRRTAAWSVLNTGDDGPENWTNTVSNSMGTYNLHVYRNPLYPDGLPYRFKWTVGESTSSGYSPLREGTADSEAAAKSAAEAAVPGSKSASKTAGYGTLYIVDDSGAKIAGPFTDEEGAAWIAAHPGVGRPMYDVGPWTDVTDRLPVGQSWASKTAGTDPDDQSGDAESSLEDVEVGDDEVIWPWEIQGEAASGEGASNVSGTHTPGQSVADYPQPKTSRYRATAGRDLTVVTLTDPDDPQGMPLYQGSAGGAGAVLVNGTYSGTDDEGNPVTIVVDNDGSRIASRRTADLTDFGEWANLDPMSVYKVRAGGYNEDGEPEGYTGGGGTLADARQEAQQAVADGWESVEIVSDNGHVVEKVASRKTAKTYDIGYGHLGNGITVWNRAEEKGGDYVTVAHIGPDRTVKFYDSDLPADIKAEIEEYAAKGNPDRSATQPGGVFHDASLSPVTAAFRARVQASLSKEAMPNPVDLGVQVGDIFYSSWGYDQTNIDFFKVVGLTGASVKVVEVGQKVVDRGHGADYVMPDPSREIGEVMTKRLANGYSGAAFNVNSYASAFLWDGKPKYQTASGWGH